MQARLNEMRMNNINPDDIKYKKKQLYLPRGTGAGQVPVTYRQDALEDVTDIVLNVKNLAIKSSSSSSKSCMQII